MTVPAVPANLPRTLSDLLVSGWRSRTVKEEVRANFLRMLEAGDELFPGIVGYDDTVIPEIDVALIAGHDMLFLGEKGQAKSRLMRLLPRFLDEWLPFIDAPGLPFHEDPLRPISREGRRLVAETESSALPVGWWHRSGRYAERLAPGTKFADIIGEIDPARLAGGTSMSAEEALHFGLIPRMHRGIFAMNELPELDELVQVGLFNILEERDVQIRGYPVSFDIDVMLLFSANPSTFNRSGKVIPQLKDRIGSIIHTHYPRERDVAMRMTAQECGMDLGGEWPVIVPAFMREVLEEITIQARRHPSIDHQSGVSARFSIANLERVIASARHRAVRLGERPAVPRVSDLAHLHASSLGKLELDLMGSHQMSERQVLESIVAAAIAQIFGEYVGRHGLEAIAGAFTSGARVEVGDAVPSSEYRRIVEDVPGIWERAFDVNVSADPAVRASCVEFVLAGLHATDRISRVQAFGKTIYDTSGLN